MKNSLIGLVVIAIIAIGGYFFPHAGAIALLGGVTNYDQIGVQQLKIGSTCNDSSTYSSCSGTAISGINDGKCYVRASSITIAASSTATVDCQASTGATPSALTGVTLGDTVLVNFATSTPTTFQGLNILGASASTTSGYITMKVFNGTGDTYTWTSDASTTNYMVVR